ncbi:M64 family metallopeptidase [Kitasatospora purpeofusca]|uniref:M64 family metallopeptidase n=1 Tax=Kitasatospora purpeofusca TaxID=67352 RepID=A0ABZ1UCU5_9ACTN|nr:M64 family metallopeptidase [Kitasatospora purpeofusca]
MRNSRFTSLLLAGATASAALTVGAGPAVAAPSDPAAATAPSDPSGVTVPADPDGAAAPADPDGVASSPGEQDVEVFAEDGAISRARVPAASPFVAEPSMSAAAAGDGAVTKIVNNGSTDSKLDVVLIGDGYTAAEQEKFRKDAAAKWKDISAVQPYATYRKLFNVWAVGAVSAQSGVSGDPKQSTVRTTALGSRFWCNSVERLLCVDIKAVDAYAAKAPQADLVIVVANTAKYGGAGYGSTRSPLGYEGIATVAGGNAASGQIAVHETGHSLGKLADEYVAENQGPYQGAEPPQPNLTTLSADRMRKDKAKWYRWLGKASPDGGTVGAYQGGGNHPSGLNRPTDNSVMRSLGREFNLPGREAMIAGFYRRASTLTSATPTTTRLTATDRLTVDLPVSGTKLRWYLDGKEVTALRDRRTIAVSDLGPTGPKPAAHELKAVANDPTSAVVDPALTPALTRALVWSVTR